MNGRYLLATLIVLSGCPAAQIDRLTALQTGTFDSLAANPNQDPADRLVDTRIRLDIPALGTHVFYQQINHREELSVYRQRILVVSTTGANGLVQTAYTLNERDRYVDAPSEAFSGLTMKDLTLSLPEGCEQTFEGGDNFEFRGYVDPTTCVIVSSRTGKRRGIEAESILTGELLKLAERGYDPESGEQLFGTEPGEYLILKRVRREDRDAATP